MLQWPMKTVTEAISHRLLDTTEITKQPPREKQKERRVCLFRKFDRLDGGKLDIEDQIVTYIKQDKCRLERRMSGAQTRVED